MRAFAYTRAEDEGAALRAAEHAEAAYLAGGTTLLDLMKLEVMAPGRLVDVNALPLNAVEVRADGVRIGALATNTDVAYHEVIRARYPVLSEALLAGASPQLRNMATVGGNLMQRTRCPYFRDPPAPCNKRAPGSGCSAVEGYSRAHAVLGGSGACVATHASDMCVALAALDAVVHTRGARGERSIPFTDFHLLPGDHPERETVLEHGELITAVTLPASPLAAHSRYLKVRDRASYAFALASVAAALDVQGGIIVAARVALGGVATKPWRAFDAEKALVGKAPGDVAFRAAAEIALRGAAPLRDNAFKVELAKRVIVRALASVGEAS
jgi:xanthine dehydrogenase YagS FAD-binding subunit